MSSHSRSVFMKVILVLVNVCIGGSFVDASSMQLLVLRVMGFVRFIIFVYV